MVSFVIKIIQVIDMCFKTSSIDHFYNLNLMTYN